MAKRVWKWVNVLFPLQKSLLQLPTCFSSSKKSSWTCFFFVFKDLQKMSSSKNLLSLLDLLFRLPLVSSFWSLKASGGMTDGRTMGVGQLTAPILASPLRFPRVKWQTRTQTHTDRQAHTLKGTDWASGKVKRFHMCVAWRRDRSCSWPPRHRPGESQVLLALPVKCNLWSAHRWNAPAHTCMLHVRIHMHTDKHTCTSPK